MLINPLPSNENILLQILSKKYLSWETTITTPINSSIKSSSIYVLLNELDQEKTKLEEELLEKYERQEYLEDIAKKIEEYNSKKQ